MTGPARRPWSDPSFRVLSWLTIGAIGWIGVLGLIGIGLSASPPKVGFDLRLILEAGARVASGASPYDPALVAGTPPTQAQDLFYSYPPPVAQIAALVSGVPLGVALVGLGMAAVAGVAWVALRLTRCLARSAPAREVALATVAVLPYLFPFSVAVLFGNLDALYPLVYGALLLASLTPSRDSIVTGGVALALASVAKLHPAVLGLWLLARGAHEWRAARARVAWRILGVAAVACLVVVAVSIALGGIGPWQDYVSVVRAISSADLVLAKNVGPAAQIAFALGLGEPAARLLHVAVVVVVLAVIVLMGWFREDPVESLAWAALASLLLLPVTWYHYPSALIPFGLAALLRALDTTAASRTAQWIVGAVAASVVSIAVPVLVLLAAVAAAISTRAARPLGRAPVETW